MIPFTEIYNTLRKLDIKERSQDKNGLTYIPWAIALDEVSKRYDTDFEFEMFDDGTGRDYSVPYLDTPVGLFVKTNVTVEGHTRSMMLPVMDNRNNGMSLTERDGGKTKVAAAVSTNVNKALMRCLTKNLAVFGLMIGLWGKEDVPDAVIKQQELATKCLAKINELTRKAREYGDDKVVEKVGEICKSVLPEECNGDPRLCGDEEKLRDLELKLRAVRVVNTAKAKAKEE